jgi:hypothetical protein
MAQFLHLDQTGLRAGGAKFAGSVTASVLLGHNIIPLADKGSYGN